jgi:hypothetical protein
MGRGRNVLCALKVLTTCSGKQWWCPSCKIVLCIEGCFNRYNTRLNDVEYYYSYYIHVILNVNWFMVVFDRLWSGRAVTEHKYVFLVFFCFCVYLHVSLHVSNHFNHFIKLFAPCGTLIGNKQFLFLFLF